MPRRPSQPSFEEAAALLGRKVQTAREALALTQEELAHLANISRNQVQNIEKNRNNRRSPESGKAGPGNPRLETVYSLARALRVDINWLVDPGQPVEPLKPDAPRRPSAENLR